MNYRNYVRRYNRRALAARTNTDGHRQFVTQILGRSFSIDIGADRQEQIEKEREHEQKCEMKIK